MKKPPFRFLKGYAFDPSMSLEMDTVGINEIYYKIPWEENLKPGPAGEYVRVVDRDPSSNAFYKPVDLNDLNLLANDGLEPSVNNPQFHQQMVYAVAMNTINNFEKAIGRKIQWSPLKVDRSSQIKNTKNNKSFITNFYVEKLILYPHAFREANAYYSPSRKAILFGYFEATPASADLHMPGSIVFTCLSHDIIAHEVTHAIIDGMFSEFMESTNLDVSAFHEALSDIVALFQRFTFTEIINHEIARTKGSFDVENLFGKLAVEFGKASGAHGSLRDGIGTYDKRKRWKRIKPDINSYKTDFECHLRGSILVASVFDAFLSIYNKRASEIIKIATGGTGVLPIGELSAHLSKALASEASKAALHVLNMCIRALDYCPYVDIRYSDYLRAIITADSDLVAFDKYNYRLAFIDAFKKRGIYPEGISNLSVESLTFTPDSESNDFEEFSISLGPFLKDFKNTISYINNRRKIYNKTKQFLFTARIKKLMGDNAEHKGLEDYIWESIGNNNKMALLFERLTGLVFTKNFKKLNVRNAYNEESKPYIKIHDLRFNNRVGPDGNLQNQIIIILGQTCGVKVIPNENIEKYKYETFPYFEGDKLEDNCFKFQGACTLVFDLDSEIVISDNEITPQLKYVISKPLLDLELLNKTKPEYSVNQDRAKMQYECLFGELAEITGALALKGKIEPLSYLHRTVKKI